MAWRVYPKVCAESTNHFPESVEDRATAGVEDANGETERNRDGRGAAIGRPDPGTTSVTSLERRLIADNTVLRLTF